jgi:DNA sulfur modification protein DndB
VPQIAATEVTYNGFTYYAGIISGKDLLPIARVSRRDEDLRGGFNRALSEQRAREIARYLDTDRLSIPTNIIVSAQRTANVRFSHGHLEYASAPGAFLVLDGQHRLFSMRYTERDYPFGVAIYAGLTTQQEVRLFIDINTKQKGVPTALLLDIKHLAGAETTIEEKLRRLFDYVSGNSNSPLSGLLSPAATKPGLVSRVSFNTALKSAVQAGPLSHLEEDEDRGRLVVNYLIAADRVIRESGAVQNNLTKATVLQAFFEVFNEAVEQTLGTSGSLRPDDLTGTMQPLAAVNFDAYIGSNRPSKRELVAEMRARLTASPVVTGDML